jgi:hypothetical protein
MAVVSLMTSIQKRPKLSGILRAYSAPVDSKSTVLQELAIYLDADL